VTFQRAASIRDLAEGGARRTPQVSLSSIDARSILTQIKVPTGLRGNMHLRLLQYEENHAEAHRDVCGRDGRYRLSCGGRGCA
jgi:hypothetical protein